MSISTRRINLTYSGCSRLRSLLGSASPRLSVTILYHPSTRILLFCLRMYDHSIYPLLPHVIFTRVTAWYTVISASYFLLSFQRTQADDAFKYYQRHGRRQSMVDLPVRTHPSRLAHTLWVVPTWIVWTVSSSLLVSLPEHRTGCGVYCTQVQALDVFVLIEL